MRLRRAPTSLDEALLPIADSSPIRLHGAAASLLNFAPRIGTLMAARHSDPEAAQRLAAVWRAVHDAHHGVGDGRAEGGEGAGHPPVRCSCRRRRYWLRQYTVNSYSF